jgi:hypothetical protein
MNTHHSNPLLAPGYRPPAPCTITTVSVTKRAVLMTNPATFVTQTAVLMTNPATFVTQTAVPICSVSRDLAIVDLVNIR